ncbi:hypothetical protein D3C80_1934770 [compost metagenome]
MITPTAQGRQELAVAILGDNFAQRFEQFVQRIVVAMPPEHHRQSITGQRQQARTRQYIAPIRQQVTDTPVAAPQPRQSLGLPAYGNAQNVPAQAVEFFQQPLIFDSL